MRHDCHHKMKVRQKDELLWLQSRKQWLSSLNSACYDFSEKILSEEILKFRKKFSAPKVFIKVDSLNVHPCWRPHNEVTPQHLQDSHFTHNLTIVLARAPELQWYAAVILYLLHEELGTSNQGNFLWPEISNLVPINRKWAFDFQAASGIWHRWVNNYPITRCTDVCCRWIHGETCWQHFHAVRSFVQPVVTVLKSGKVLSTVFSSAVACRVLPYAFPSSSPPARSPSSVTSFKIPSSQYDSSLPIKTAFLAPDERFTPKHCDNARRASTFKEINFSSKPVSSSWVQADPFLRRLTTSSGRPPAEATVEEGDIFTVENRRGKKQRPSQSRCRSTVDCMHACRPTFFDAYKHVGGRAGSAPSQSMAKGLLITCCIPLPPNHTQPPPPPTHTHTHTHTHAKSPHSM